MSLIAFNYFGIVRHLADFLSVCLFIQLPEKQKKTITNTPGRVGAFGLDGSTVGSGIKAKG